MNEQRIIITKGGDMTRAFAVIQAMVRDGATEISVKPHKARRSDQQNRYLFGVVYKTILQHLPGWDVEDVHEYFLGYWSGWDVLEGFGKKRLKPVKRSSKLSTTEFMDFISFIQRHMAEKGVYIPDPNEGES